MQLKNKGFYEIKVQSKTLGEQGESGTVGIYKVYRSGDYDLSY